MRIRLLHDFVLVEPLPEATLYKGAIIIPERAREIPASGTVRAIGPGARDERGERMPMGVEVGDRVVYRQHLGYEVDIDGTHHRVLHESDIMGIEERSPASVADPVIKTIHAAESTMRA